MLKTSKTGGEVSVSSPLSQNRPNVQVQKLPLKCVGSVESLVEALQGLAGKPDSFKIEMRHNSYIITSHQEIKIKDILARMAGKGEILSPQDPSLLPSAAEEDGGDTSDVHLKQETRVCVRNAVTESLDSS
ncbi:hypothetical protein B0I37DRAFT_384031 [Chaetomium sp. MPI-CAGE-AT-0009]|nr:hypothetical protein B0I37DRAFT_384031 [Chaetomium sp. MPI-CAGE-AT-0009]